MTDGFINLLKPPGLTSHGAVSQMRRLLKTRAIGHAGTLDPAASGVLPLAVGKATRLLEYIVEQDKTYIGEVTFGVLTDTLDQEGQILWQAPRPPSVDFAQLEKVLASMVGEREQVPPAYSAIKYQGRPLYEYARAGKIVQVPARPITIHALTI
ncbi:MAG: tRNA pseudouridine(55) synthase TruB [Firmicutes bacterium]|nr:tRNA pseudouridine(55) synthase TruB [Bacillota bacterium]